MSGDWLRCGPGQLCLDCDKTNPDGCGHPLQRDRTADRLRFIGRCVECDNKFTKAEWLDRHTLGPNLFVHAACCAQCAVVPA